MIKHPKKWLRVLIPSFIITLWIAFAGLGGPYFGKISDVSSTDLTTFLPSSAESTKVNNELSKFRDDKAIPIIVVFNQNGNKLKDDQVASINSIVQELGSVKGVTGEVSPALLSDDGKAAFAVVPVDSDGDFKQIFNEIKADLSDSNVSVDYKLTGPASFAHDLQKAFAGIDGTLLFVALGVVFVILLVVYRSPFLPFVVLLTSMAALATAIFVVYYLAKAGIVQLNGQVQGILFILVIGAATDYSLLYISRYKEELRNNKTAWQATRTAIRTSFEPIIAAGATVTAGLLCLLFSDLGSNKALGPVGGIGIALSVAAALTLLPALLFALGRPVFWPRRPEYAPGTHANFEDNHRMWAKIGAFVRRHPRRIWVGGMIVLLFACAGVFQLKAEGVSQSNLILGKSEAREGQEVLNAHFPAGSGSPASVIATKTNQEAVIAALESNKGVDSVSVIAENTRAGSMPVGKAATELKATIKAQVEVERSMQIEQLRTQVQERMVGAPQFVIDTAVAAAVANIPSTDVIAAQAYPFNDAKEKVVDGKVLLQVTLSDAADSLAARETVVELRKETRKVDDAALVGGTTAAQYDTNQAALHDEKTLIPLILVAITLILMALLRAIIAPLLLLITTVISFGTTLGISAMLFNHVWGFPGADPSVIIFGFVFLVALGIDYNIFLMTRVREETIKNGVAKGTIKGLVVTGGVITSAGIVLAATFAALGVIPILFLVQVAFIVAFGVLIDTIIVRSLIVPALTLEVGRWMWWPSGLWRNLGKKD